MHGRVKVRTTEEEKARKEKERQEKLKIFKHAMKRIQEKRKQGELDNELLELTGKVLTSNPDIYTLWNIRREILIIFSVIFFIRDRRVDILWEPKRKQGELDNELLELTGKVLTSNPDIYTLWNIRREILIIFSKNIEVEDEMSEIYDSELYLTECCLKINPKSYCAWHQREWVLMTRPNPDWKKELSLCNMYLKYDERNFHTWDYRRFVVSQCKPPLKEEFDFTTEKLYDNFSNYSAWHYRSKMLVELYPDLEGGRPIEDGHHKHELKMVESAAFTDPDDTSAWFYQRWLLGAVKTNTNLVACTVTPTKTTVAFSKHIEQEYVQSKTNLVINNVSVNGDWVSCTGNAYDVLWVLKHSELITDDMDIRVEYVTENDEKQIMSCKMYGQCKYIARNKIDFQMKYSEPVIEELNKQLESCRQLLVLEPDSKWTLLTTTFLLHCIDEKKYHSEVTEKLQTLQTIDKMRAGYYIDLLTKWSIEKQIVEDYENEVSQFSIRFIEKITYLPHLQYYSFCENVDLSNQNLISNVLPSLVMLQCCKTLSLENNKLTTLKDFPELDLKELNLRGNEQLDKQEIELFKKKCNYRIIF